MVWRHLWVLCVQLGRATVNGFCLITPAWGGGDSWLRNVQVYKSFTGAKHFLLHLLKGVTPPAPALLVASSSSSSAVCIPAVQLLSLIPDDRLGGLSTKTPPPPPRPGVVRSELLSLV